MCLLERWGTITNISFFVTHMMQRTFCQFPNPYVSCVIRASNHVATPHYTCEMQKIYWCKESKIRGFATSSKMLCPRDVAWLVYIDTQHPSAWPCCELLFANYMFVLAARKWIANQQVFCASQSWRHWCYFISTYLKQGNFAWIRTFYVKQDM